MRYIIGIDLGTTNSCVSYVDTQDPKLTIQSLRIPQVVSAGYVESLPSLPSFCYLCSQHEWPTGSLALPWNKNSDGLIGFLAQSHGSKVPTRLVQSAKSWLCHSAANRKDKILPMEGDHEYKISPLEATAKYLSHIKEAWNYLLGKKDFNDEFDQQEIILTVPASFDEVARRLTAEAAKMAGYNHLTLLEEPQAAFYSWISLHEDQWQKFFRPNDSILVCDVGGGTTDFSLIEVRESNGKLAFNRMAVGDHLLLGGDNMDAAIAHYIEKKFFQEHHQQELHTSQWLQMKCQARFAKETLLDISKSQEIFPITIQGTGSSIVKGSLSTQIQREEITTILLNGFFAQHSWDEALKLHKSSGFRTMGLPYEEEPSITKHLAAFLKRAQLDKAPEYVLFNGGAMKPGLFQQAILQSLKTWHPASTLQVLQSISLDFAVSRGAAYYGKVRRGLGERIGGGTSKAYYLGIDIKSSDGHLSHQALTLLPRGAEESASFEYPQIFSLRPNIPVSFNLYTSQVRLSDKKGDLIPIDSKELQLLPPIHTLLRLGKNFMEHVPVRLNVSLTAIGTIELWLQSEKTEHRWTLEFQLRNASGQENHISGLAQARQDENFDASYLQSATNYIRDIFNTSSKPARIMESLENLINQPRRDWSISILRTLFDALITIHAKRKVNSDFEARWWNMAGFFLRPGFGYPLDDFRIKEIWKIILGDFNTPVTAECQIQKWICYRRISGGLNKGQQTQLANEIQPSLMPNKSNKIILKVKSDLYPYSEKIRTLASFELLDISQKIKIGQALLDRLLNGNTIPADFWSLGRIGARHLIYGSAANIISREECTTWIRALLKLPISEHLMQLFAQLARKTDYREHHLAQTVVDEIISYFDQTPYQERLQQLLTQTSSLTTKEKEQILGDNLPAGLILENM